MDLKGIEHDVYVLCLAILKLAQDLYLMYSILDGVILRSGIDFVVGGIHVDDLEGYNTVVLLIEAA